MPGLRDMTAAPGPAPADAPVDAQQGQQASPEEQEIYDNLVSRCYLLIFDETTRKPRESVVAQLKSGDPKEALGKTAAAIFFRVEQEAAKAGQKIPGDVKEQAGAEVFSTMAELAEKAGVGDFAEGSDEFNGAFIIAANTLQNLEAEGGLQDPEETSQDFDALMQADRSGQLAQIVGQGAAPAQTGGIGGA